MKVYAYAAPLRRTPRFAFFCEYAEVTGEHSAKALRRTYKWLRQAGLGVHHARLAVWRMFAAPIVDPHHVTVVSSRWL